jgi:hypothetical protein
MCCLLVLDSVTSTPQCIRQPRPRVYLKEPPAPPPQPPTPRPPPTTTGWREERCPVVSKRPLHRAMQQRCHHASASARSPSWLPMPRLRLHQPHPAREDSAPHCGTDFFHGGPVRTALDTPPLRGGVSGHGRVRTIFIKGVSGHGSVRAVT